MNAQAACDTSILISNYNTVAWLERCVQAVQRENLPSCEVIVLDNGSTDGSAERMRNGYPEVRTLAISPNVGYVRAVNQLLEASQGRTLILLDSDAEPEPDALRHLIAALQAAPELGAIGPRLVGNEGKLQRWTAGKLPTFTSVATFYLGLDRILARAGWDVGLFLARDVQQPMSIDWLSSCCLALRREAIVKVGLMDERYFSYLGDLDLCRRIAAAGWSLRYDPTAIVRHAQGRNTVRDRGHATPEAVTGLDDYLALHQHALTGLALAALQVVGYAGRAAVYFLIGKAFHNARASGLARLHWMWLCIRCKQPPNTIKRVFAGRTT